MAVKPNICIYFTDQQRADTIGAYGQKLEVTPALDALAKKGVLFEQAYTPQPVCGPFRAVLQTGKYATRTGVWRNNLPLPDGEKTLGHYLEEAGYETAYIGKWHLASYGSYNQIIENYRESAIPPEKHTGYTGYWRVADVLEVTSHSEGGYLFDEKMRKLSFEGYRVDCITDYALEYLDQYDGKKPFFMTISQLEPHHQNDRGHIEGPQGSKQRFCDFELPGDLEALGGNAREEYPDYLGCCRSLDDNLHRLVERLKQKGLYENTIIIYVSDHGAHFYTRNQDEHFLGVDDYKRSGHSACLHVPLIISGPGFAGGVRVPDLVSTVSLTKTILAIAGIHPDGLDGEDLKQVAQGCLPDRKNEVFAQISESKVGRCIRTEKYLYGVYAPGLDGCEFSSSDIYEDDYLYDLEKDPYELHNLIGEKTYETVRDNLAGKLIEWMYLAGENRPVITKKGGFL